MAAPLVIKHLDVVEQSYLCIAATVKPIGELRFHRREEAFHHGVVVAVATAAHTARDAVRVESPLVVLARVWAAPVGMMEQSYVGTPSLQRHVQRLQRQMAHAFGLFLSGRCVEILHREHSERRQNDVERSQ